MRGENQSVRFYNEFGQSESELKFKGWCIEVSKGLGNIQLDKELAFDLFSDDCSVEDAITEIAATSAK
ncbi:hypothetical protein [Vibrio cholerae]|uniref:Uncharacterized protein n=1 Tax=Vibrio cholerae TaxID=666 RepID=A0ABD7SSE0_VIBCL|nr:hypothetical protein [Vibrio cholerae]TXX67216.1 hypothetical protein FXF03_01195 [Vibrio cholerae]GIA99563.1 hypothetical protein VCSRO136_2372 [Vibrio cholerae]